MHLLSIKDLAINDINEIFSLADQMKENKKMLLEGKTFVLFFPESSIRTRLSFEKGIKSLGGKCVLFPPETLDKREALMDVVGYIENWADGIVIRHRDFEKVTRLASASNIPIINAMTSYNHPCEIISDLYSIKNVGRDYQSLTYTFVGENGNIGNTWRIAAEILDFSFNHVSTKNNRMKMDDQNYTFTTNLDDVLSSTDVMLTDPLSKDMRIQEYIEKYQVTLKRMEQCKDNSMLNPCPPFFRGEEVSEDVINSKYFVGYDFKKNLLYVQQSIILYCLRN
ncbi:MAG TPA: ornithine carbamoyltransferase [Clostridia bacterium]|nr:ornithine carbamoyltransferase [Clostridia bacterium]